MDKVRECFNAYNQIEDSMKEKAEYLDERLKEIEEEAKIFRVKISADKRIALTKVLKAIGETAKNEKVREFVLRSINFTSIEGTEYEIYRLIDLGLDKLDVGDKIKCNQRFSISILGYRNELRINCDNKGIITEIELSTISNYE